MWGFQPNFSNMYKAKIGQIDLTPICQLFSLLDTFVKPIKFSKMGRLTNFISYNMNVKL